MTDETQTAHSTEESTPDDEIEVRWRKKSERPARPAEPESTTEAPPSSALQEELEQERQRVRDLQDRWQRAAADLVNLRRRTEQDRAEVEKFATMLLVQELLPVLDNFERAIATIPGNLAMLTWIHGVVLVERHLRAILERQGLEPIEAQGKPFNPHFHEAIAEVESSEQAPETVVREYQRGYTMHGRVIRPTLVEIAKAPGAAPTTDEPAQEQPAPEATNQGDAEHIVDEAETKNVGP